MSYNRDSYTQTHAPHQNTQIQSTHHLSTQEHHVFPKGIAMPSVPQKSKVFELDSKKQWEIHALEKIATHPQTRANRAQIPMRCPDCHMQGIDIFYTPTEYTFDNLRWSTQQIHFVKTHGHDLPYNIRKSIPDALTRADEYMRDLNKPKTCPQCNSQIDMSMQNPRELMCFRCGMSFLPNVFTTQRNSHTIMQNSTTHPPQNPQFALNTHDNTSKSHDDTSEGFMYDRPSFVHASHLDSNESVGYNEWEYRNHSAFGTGPVHDVSSPEHISRKTNRYVTVLAEIEQSPSCMRHVSNSNIDCHICASKGVSIKVPVGTMSYSGITWGAHTLHNIVFHGESVPDDMKTIAKMYVKNKKKYNRIG